MQPEIPDNSFRPSASRLTATILLGIAAVSCGSIFVRLAAAPALAVAAYRVAWATLLFSPLTLAGPVRELRPLSRRDWYLVAGSGAALALHFALWIASLSFTSVASSVLLVDTTPFFIGVASHWILRRPCPRSFWTGLGIAFLGCLLIFHGDLMQSGSAMRGNILALGGAASFAIYLMMGSEARRRLSLLAYVWPVYGAAALALIPACLLLGTPLAPYSVRTHFYMFLLGLVPQGIGHTSYNWSLRWLPAHLVALISLAEPVGASVLAWIILGEALTADRLAGGAVILLGIYLATRKGKS